ncbi:MAG TPA: helix-turn-helix domain-containing protein, partial [Candidatus Norongarragalinales archaeon]|nr:helix-turn-helix domain-containing protein [Candidatus Norongarragalinales archaeon]
QKALSELRHETRIRQIERGENYVIYQLPELKGFHHLVMDRRFLFLKPPVVEKGFEYWTVAATKKEDLLKFYKNLKGLRFRATVELISLRKLTPNFFRGALLADLTAKQRTAFEMALHSNYYDYPRKADAQTLAPRCGMKYTTFMEHLRKAEGKIMAALAGNA